MGPTFIDYDNDGYLDLFNSAWEGRITLYRNNGDGTFSEVAKQVGLAQENHSSWGSAAVDYDDDGDLDIYVANVFANDLFLRNDGGNDNNWLRVKVIGTRSNRSGIGTVVRVTVGDMTQTRPIGLAYTNSHNELVAHFGLGQENQADVVEVEWPTTGVVNRYTNVAANQVLTITEEELAVEPHGKQVTTFGKIKVQLYQNYPNPFNPDTWIPYRLEEDAEVSIQIHSATGQLIRKLNLGHKQAGPYMTRDSSAHWDGNNEAGEPVASGIYFYTIQAGRYTAIKKMTARK